MNAELKTKWVAALKSGAYKQGAGYLHKGDRHCCLGVLCEVAGVEQAKTVNRDDGVRGEKVTLYDGAYMTLTDGTLATVGLLSEQAYALMLMNDKGGRSFEYIADYVQEYL